MIREVRSFRTTVLLATPNGVEQTVTFNGVP